MFMSLLVPNADSSTARCRHTITLSQHFSITHISLLVEEEEDVVDKRNFVCLCAVPCWCDFGLNAF